MFFNNSIRAKQHFLHTSNEISTFLKITIQTYKKRSGFSLLLNNSIHVTEPFLHTSNEISIFLKITIQKYQKNTRNMHVFQFLHPCDGAFFAYVTRNINIFENRNSKVSKTQGICIVFEFLHPCDGTTSQFSPRFFTIFHQKYQKT